MSSPEGFMLGIGLIALVAACGGSQAPPSGQRSQAAAVWHSFVQCARENGMPDLPEPTVDDQGQPHFPGGYPSPPSSVRQACAGIVVELPGNGRAGAGNVASLRTYAQCMRDHSIDDWPDPDAVGTFHLAPTLWANLKSGPRWPAIEAAWQACRHDVPTGHISTVPA